MDSVNSTRVLMGGILQRLIDEAPPAGMMSDSLQSMVEVNSMVDSLKGMVERKEKRLRVLEASNKLAAVEQMPPSDGNFLKALREVNLSSTSFAELTLLQDKNGNVSAQKKLTCTLVSFCKAQVLKTVAFICVTRQLRNELFGLRSAKITVFWSIKMKKLS